MSAHRALRAVPDDRPPRRPVTADPAVCELVAAARDGDGAAWTALVRRFEGSLRGIARSYRLPPSDIDDVVQMTWLDLLEAIHRIREPAAIAGWLATTTRRNAMRRKNLTREQPSDDPELGEETEHGGPEAAVLAGERSAALLRALAMLPDRHRRLMTVMLAQPALDYQQVGDILDMPVGSIGPIRGRCLERLRRDAHLSAVWCG
jgi:RNA polymerase sigma factor (sigma-70 family)